MTGKWIICKCGNEAELHPSTEVEWKQCEACGRIGCWLPAPDEEQGMIQLIRFSATDELPAPSKLIGRLELKVYEDGELSMYILNPKPYIHVEYQKGSETATGHLQAVIEFFNRVIGLDVSSEPMKEPDEEVNNG